MKIVTFLWEKRHPAKRVVDFPLERDTFRNKIMEIVDDFDKKKESYNNNGKPWKSSRILRVKPNFLVFISFFIIFLHVFSFFPFFFIFSFHFSFFSFFFQKNFHFFIFHFFIFFDFVGCSKSREIETKLRPIFS